MNIVVIIRATSTIQNSKEFANWIQRTTQRPTMLLQYSKRVVPLQHYVWYSYPKIPLDRKKDKYFRTQRDDCHEQFILIQDEENLNYF